MLAQSYSAKDEFELYGSLVRDLSLGDFTGTIARIVVYKREGNSWHLFEEYYPPSMGESGDYFQKMIKEHFAVAIDLSDFTVGMHGRQLCVLVKFESEAVATLDFEDLSPNERFKAYQALELEKSAEFLRKVLSGD